MIDTIIIVIHNANEHPIILNFLAGARGAKQKFYSEYSDEELLLLTKHRHHLKMIDTNTFIGQTKWSSDLYSSINSDHYKIASHHNEKRDIITINISIPKYIYGHNIAQFLPSNFIITSFNESYDFNSKIVYDNIFNFIETFFNANFGYCPDMRFIELQRIDLCFNMFFKDKKEALAYEQNCKSIKKAHSRNTTDLHEHNTSSFLKVFGRGFSIYHKGGEYYNNDRLQHIEINKRSLAKKQLPVFDIEYLQSVADRIVRFEMKIESKYISYLFRHKIFRSECLEHRKYIRYYKQSKVLKDKKVDLYLKLPKWRKQIHQDYSKKMFLRDKVFFKNDFEEIQEYYKSSPVLLKITADSITNGTLFEYTIEKNHFQRIKFSYNVWELMINEFNKFIENYNINTLPSMPDIEKKINEYNMKAHIFNTENILKIQRKQLKTLPSLSYSSLAVVCQLLKENSFDDIKKMKLYKERTFYDIKKRLSLIGIDQKTMNFKTAFTPDKTFGSYYKEVINNHLHFKSFNYSFDMSFKQRFPKF